MNQKLKKRLNKVDNYEDLLKIANNYLSYESQDKKIGFISHTIFSYDDFEKNLLKIKKLIEKYSSEEYFIFNQIPFLDSHLSMIKNIKGDTRDKFEYFFKPLFEKRIDKVYFDKKSLELSKGTKKEYEYAKLFGLEIEIID